MGWNISDATKQARKMGLGEGAEYKPYIITREFNSLGTTSIIRDWKTGRSVHCLSQAEALWYYILRWDDDNVDIREQFPLDNELTQMIAEKLKIRHPKDKEHIMTTDFLATRPDGSYHAYTVKSSKNLSERNGQIIKIERTYWTTIFGCEFDILYKTDANRTLADNIRKVSKFYDSNSVYDKYSCIKYLIATRQIEADLSSETLDVPFMDRLAEEVKDRLEAGI